VVSIVKPPRGLLATLTLTSAAAKKGETVVIAEPGEDPFEGRAQKGAALAAPG
jgi:hypothetical protein